MNKAAQELGRLGKGKPKTLTKAERKRRAERLAKARENRWADKATFPNPLCVRFGEGRILMLTFTDADGGGVVLRDSGEAHAVGEDANLPPEKGVMPKVGEVYLHFTNIESAQALRLTLDEAIAEMSNTGVHAPKRSGGSS